MTWSDRLIAFGRDERVLFVCIGVATFGILSTMMTALTLIRDDSEIPPTEPKTEYITQETEDALQLETLDKLVDHPNYSIRKVALRIVSERAANDPEVTKHLLRGTMQRDYDTRLKCLRALLLLSQQTSGFDGPCNMNTPLAHEALVRSLELGLDDAHRPALRDGVWDDFDLRDTAERFCLKLLKDMTQKYDTNLLVRAKFVEKWLSKQDWGDTPEDIKENFKSYLETKKNKLCFIVKRLQATKRGLKALEKCGLVDRHASLNSIRELPDIMMEDVIGDAPLERQPRRAREHSMEEQRLRRQHREAMVLNDGSRPLAREDIIEREYSGTSMLQP